MKNILWVGLVLPFSLFADDIPRAGGRGLDFPNLLGPIVECKFVVKSHINQRAFRVERTLGHYPTLISRSDDGLDRFVGMAYRERKTRSNVYRDSNCWHTLGWAHAVWVKPFPWKNEWVRWPELLDVVEEKIVGWK